MERPHNSKNEVFNEGADTLIDVFKLKCPCGKLLKDEPKATICSACCTATCSAKCHKMYRKVIRISVTYFQLTAD